MDESARLFVLPEVDSTSSEARRRLEAGAQAPFWTQALAQTAARGRRGRSWASLDGNVFVTGAFRAEAPIAQAAQLSFAAALAVAELMDAYVEPTNVTLKWPNDVLLAGRKASGILLEAHGAADEAILLVGIGVNLRAAPEGAACVAGHLRDGAQTPGPERAGERLARAFERWRARWRAEGFAPVRSAWLARAHGLGGEVTARAAERELTGVFEDLAPDGALVLRVGAERERVRAGEVFFPGGDTAR